MDVTKYIHLTSAIQARQQKHFPGLCVCSTHLRSSGLHATLISRCHTQTPPRAVCTIASFNFHYNTLRSYYLKEEGRSGYGTRQGGASSQFPFQPILAKYGAQGTKKVQECRAEI